MIGGSLSNNEPIGHNPNRKPNNMKTPYYPNPYQTGVTAPIPVHIKWAETPDTQQTTNPTLSPTHEPETLEYHIWKQQHQRS